MVVFVVDLVVECVVDLVVVCVVDLVVVFVVDFVVVLVVDLVVDSVVDFVVILVVDLMVVSVVVLLAVVVSVVDFTVEMDVLAISVVGSNSWSIYSPTLLSTLGSAVELLQVTLNLIGSLVCRSRTCLAAPPSGAWSSLP